MKIDFLKLINFDTLEDLGTLNNEKEIFEEFYSRGGIVIDEIFNFNEAVYLTKDIALKANKNEFEVTLYVQFLQLQSELPDKVLMNP